LNVGAGVFANATPVFTTVTGSDATRLYWSSVFSSQCVDIPAPAKLAISDPADRPVFCDTPKATISVPDAPLRTASSTMSDVGTPSSTDRSVVNAASKATILAASLVNSGQ